MSTFVVKSTSKFTPSNAILMLTFDTNITCQKPLRNALENRFVHDFQVLLKRDIRN